MRGINSIQAVHDTWAVPALLALAPMDAALPRELSLDGNVLAFQDATTAILTVFRPGGETSPTAAQYSHRPKGGFWTWPHQAE